MEELDVNKNFLVNEFEDDDLLSDDDLEDDDLGVLIDGDDEDDNISDVDFV